MASYKKQTRKHWPSEALLDTQYGAAHDTSKWPSWIAIRAKGVILISNLDLWLKQGYVCFKYTVQSVLRSLRSKDSAREGRSQVGSYYLKTPWGTPSSTWRHPIPANVGLVTGSPTLTDDGEPSPYFLPECNLLRMMGEEEKQYAFKALGEVTANPLVAILNSPSEPGESSSSPIWISGWNRAMCALNTLFSQYWGHLDLRILPEQDVVRLGVTT